MTPKFARVKGTDRSKKKFAWLRREGKTAGARGKGKERKNQGELLPREEPGLISEGNRSIRSREEKKSKESLWGEILRGQKLNYGKE